MNDEQWTIEESAEAIALALSDSDGTNISDILCEVVEQLMVLNETMAAIAKRLDPEAPR